MDPYRCMKYRQIFKMNCFTTFSSILLTAATLFFITHSATSLDCSPPLVNITCECTAKMIECFGSQVDIFEAENILRNYSRTENVIFKINDLQFENHFALENASIKNLSLGYTKYGLQVLSSDFFSKLKYSLVSLNLQNNSIKVIEENFFSELSLLTELFLDNNDVENLTSNTFINLNNLQYLSISWNNLSNVRSGVFQNLMSLETVILSHNKFLFIENIDIHSATLKNLKIDNCLIEDLIHKNSLKNIPTVENLNISYNKISRIESHSLSSAKNLKQLDLSYNVIEHIAENAFSDVVNITKLYLQGNKISVIKISAFEKLEKLKYLDLSGNKLTAVLCEYTSDFISLEEFHLRNNEIKTFTPGAFFYSPNLKVLDLTGNNLECACPLTESALYLIENGTMERSKMESIYCNIISTGSQLPITQYKSSKCLHSEPCKKQLVENDVEDYENDYDEATLNSTSESTTTFKHSSTTDDITSGKYTTIIPSTQSKFNVTETDSTVDPLIATAENIPSNTTFSTVTTLSEETTVPITTTQSISNDTEEGNTEKSLITTTKYNASSAMTFSTELEETTVDINKTTNHFITEIKSSTHSNESHTTPLVSSEVTTVTFSKTTTDFNDDINSNNHTAEPDTTLPISSEVTTVNFSKTTTDFNDDINANNHTEEPDTTLPVSSEVTTVNFSKTTTDFNADINSNNHTEEPDTTLPVSSEVTMTNTVFKPTTNSIIFSTTAKTSTINSLDSDFNCSSLQLSVSSLGSNLTILKNSSSKNDDFCLKWTVGRTEALKMKCSIKYTNGATITKILHLSCPSYANEIMNWSIKEKILKFCIIVNEEGKKKRQSCETLVSEKGTTIPVFVASAETINNVSSTESSTVTTSILENETTTGVASTESSKSTVLIVSDDTTTRTIFSINSFLNDTANETSSENEIITTVTDKAGTETTFLTSEKTTEDKLFQEITTSKSTTYQSGFEILTLNIYFNDSKLAFTKWTVNKRQPIHECNMTLKVSTQYFEEIEGIFPCKSNSYRLTTVKEDDIFKVCLISYHIISGKRNLCQHTLPFAKAATSENDSTNSSLIPLICLLIIVALLILFLVLKNIYKNKSVSKKYHVQIEEQKYQEREKLRPQSVEGESIRFSYISKENHENI